MHQPPDVPGYRDCVKLYRVLKQLREDVAPNEPRIPLPPPDKPAAEYKPLSTDWLAALTRIWVIADSQHPGIQIINTILPELRTARAKRGRPPVQFGGHYWATATEVVLFAGRGLQQVCGTRFGAGNLRRIVLDSFPFEDLKADCWDIKLVLAAYMSGKDAGGGTSLMAAFLRPFRYAYVQRLVARPIWDAIATVQGEPLRRWVGEFLADLDGAASEAELTLEYSLLVPDPDEPRKLSPPPGPRLSVSGETVLLDGRSVVLGATPERRLEMLKLLTILLAAGGEWRSSTEIYGVDKSLKGIRIDRLLDDLPEALRALVETNRRKGNRLIPGVWHR